MKFTLFALIGAATAMQLQKNNGPNGAAPNGWRNVWPHGIDDSTNDDTVLNWIRPATKPEPPLRFHEVGSEWQQGQWPINFSWNGDMSRASYNNEIDDGSDDNDVVDL